MMLHPHIHNRIKKKKRPVCYSLVFKKQECDLWDCTVFYEDYMNEFLICNYIYIYIYVNAYMRVNSYNCKVQCVQIYFSRGAATGLLIFIYF